MEEEKIRKMLIDFNPFWKQPFQLDYKKREIYAKITPFLKEKQIIALCGLRRVGKTMLLKKIILELLRENKPDSLLYFSFDDCEGIEPSSVIGAFIEIHKKEPRFLFFDEVQKIKNWAEKIKLLYDSEKYKIFVSGSESLFLRKGARESLAGRIFEFEIGRLSFFEYLCFGGKEKLAEKPSLYEKEIMSEFEGYLFCGGFPELIGKKDGEFVRQYIKSAINKIIFVDMPRIYSIEEPQNLLAILEILIDNPGMLTDFASLSQELGLSRQSISKYFECLESARLVKKLYNFSRNRLTSEKKLKKFYPTFLASPLPYRSDEAYAGKLIETFTVLSSHARFFWRDNYKNEVDIVLEEEGILPIEVKYSEKAEKTKGLEKFCKKFRFNKALVLTKNKRGKEKAEFADVSFIPVWEFHLGIRR